MTRFTDYDSYIRNAMQSWPCPGATVVVVKGDEVLYQGVFGLRDVENKLPMTADTRFPMASCTKAFTAMSVALLVDEGKMEWDKPVREYIPEFILNDPYVTEHITARDMLSHRTGLPRHDFSAWRLELSRAEFIQRIRHLKFNASFREKFQYNNLMYYTAAYLVERVSGQKWEDFVNERIFKPLGMTASNFQPEPPLQGQFNACGYRIDRDEEGGSKGYVLMPFGKHTEVSPGSAGALFSTLADLTQWLKVHVNEGQSGDVRLVSPDNLKQMHLPQMVIPVGGVNEALMGTNISTYGMGWFIEPYRGFTLVHHGGNVEGHSLIVGFLPKEKIGILGLTNIASLPLQNAFLYESIDRALDLEERDWNAKFHAITDPMLKGEAKSKVTKAEERIQEAPPSHPLAAYAGEFHADGYPNFGVKMSDGKLHASLLGSLDWSELRHYHYDVFDWYLADFDFWAKVRFLTNDNGEVDSVSIPIEPEVENVVFLRQEPELPEAALTNLVGEYELPIEGLSITVTTNSGKLYAAQTGQPAKEIKLYKIKEDLLGFQADRIRFDFMRDQDQSVLLVIKTPDITLEAKKKDPARLKPHLST